MSAEAQAQSMNWSDDPAPDTVNILIVDDHPEGLMTLEAVLKAPGHRLIKAASGSEAISLLESNDAAVIVLDVQMPGMDGFETAAALRRNEKTKDIPILFVTAIDKDARYIHQGYEAGAVDYIFKPFDSFVLQSKIAVFKKLYQKNRQIQEQSERLRKSSEELESRVQARTQELSRINANLQKEVAERKQMENAFRESERRFRNLADWAPVMIWMAGPDKEFNYFNKGWLDFTGRTFEQEKGMGWMENIHPDDFEARLGAFENAFQEREKFSIEYRLKNIDGTYHWVLANGVPLKNEFGFYGFIGVCVDITNRKMAEELIRESEKLQKEFVANVSHDFRTPVAVIQGYAETLINGGLEDKKNRLNFIEIIKRNADRLENLVEDLLTLSVLESDKQNSEKKVIHLKPFVDQLVNTIARLAKSKTVSIRVQIPDDAQCLVEEPDLAKILQNLLTNAIKYNRPKGSVTVACAQKGNRLRISVKDTGIGITKSDIGHVFERFYSGNRFKNRDRRGTGLGLNIVKKILERYNCDIWAKSAEGKGSTFFFTLPKPYKKNT